MTNKQIIEIVKWVKENSERESAFLSPNPVWNVNAHSLLDMLIEKKFVTKKEVEEICNK